MASDTSSTRPDDASNERAPGPNPMSRRASKLFVVASILFVIAATAGSTYYLVRMTSQALNAPVDSTATEMPVDSTMAEPDSLR